MREMIKRVGWLACGLACWTTIIRGAENWPQLRGPHGTGTAECSGLPVEFGPEKNCLWKVELPGHSAATPAVWQEHIFICTPDGEDLFLMALDLNGKQRWRQKVGTGNRKLGFNQKNNFASPSPSTDGEHVWQLVGSGDLVCCNFSGKLVWRVNLQELLGTYETGFGFGFTPLLFADSLYIPYLHQHDSYVAAIDKATGKLRWKTSRKTIAEEESKDAYSSPCVFRYADRAEIVICGADLANAYDARTGEETWQHGEINPSRNKTLRIVVSPVADAERVYVSSAKGGPVHAIRPGGRGDVTQSHHLWTCTEQTPDVPTPAVHAGLLYLLRENGVLSVLDAASGKAHFQERVARQSGAFSPSPLVADGKVYMANEAGLVVVVAAGQEFKPLATNDLGELIMASPVAVGNRLYIRSKGHLYCFAQP